MHKKHFLLIIFIASFIAGCEQKNTIESTGNETALGPENAENKMGWWRDARFGMFIHWGLYAIPAGEYQGKEVKGIGEWIMHRLNIPINEYEKFTAQFNPVDFDADQWVALAKDAGMKYIIITSKHHDGFCLWDSDITDYDIMDATPYQKDILEELARACEEQDMTLGFYHSIMDWHHPQAQAIWEPDYNVGRQDTGRVNPEFPAYYQNYLKPQVFELMEKYPSIKVLWFDGEWVPAYTHNMGVDMYNSILDVRPDMIINNRVDKGRQGMQGFNAEGDFVGDFGTPEQEIPDEGVPGLDWESCMTMNDTWGYKSMDDNWKSSETLIRNLIDIASKGGNFLLNIGPKASGKIPKPSVERLRAMGDWMEVNGESIYGTQASPFPAPAWGRFTQKGNKVYAHVFDWSDQIEIPNEEGQISRAYLLADPDVELEWKANDRYTSVLLTETAPDDVASVVVLEIEN